MMPDWNGTADGQEAVHLGEGGTPEVWVWRFVSGPVCYAVLQSAPGIPGFRGLALVASFSSRKDAADLAGLLLRSPLCCAVRVEECNPGRWERDPGREKAPGGKGGAA